MSDWKIKEEPVEVDHNSCEENLAVVKIEIEIEPVAMHPGDDNTQRVKSEPGDTATRCHHNYITITLRGGEVTSDEPAGDTSARTPRTSQRDLRAEEPHQRICDHCNKQYGRRNSLVRHIRVSHLAGYACAVCNEKFNERHVLRIHELSHSTNCVASTEMTTVKSYECPLCNKQFSKKSHLSRHTRVHTGEKPYKCAVCEKQLSFETSLSTHMRSHTGENPFECSLCYKLICSKDSLLTHIRIHTGEKPYKCSVCNKEFSVRSNLSRHTRIYTG